MERYIPANLEECFVELERMLGKEGLESFKNTEEFLAPCLDFLDVGIRNSWGLWSRSRLAIYFESMGVTNPDDMSYIILRSFHRHLNGREIRLEEQIEQTRAPRFVCLKGPKTRIVKVRQAVCIECKKECTVTFKPGPSRPVYCCECWNKLRPPHEKCDRAL